MGSSPTESTSGDRGWQQQTAEVRLKRLGRNLRRTTISVVLIGLVAALFYFLLWPLWQPTTHLVVLGDQGLDPLHGPTTAVAGAELSLLESLGETAHYHEGESLQEALDSPSNMERFAAEQLGELDLRNNDVLILYVAAQGIEFGGRPHLICHNYDPSEPEAGLYPVKELLDQLRALPAATKLLILDAGQIDADLRSGMVVNEFPRLLAQSVSDSADPNLWVLCSHQSFEWSHQSLALNGSVFGTFVATGLRGAADLNHDDKVDARELGRFVAANVSAWVAQFTNQGAEQSPWLQSGDPNASADESPALLSVEEVPEKGQPRVRLAELIKTGQSQLVPQRLAKAGTGRRGMLAELAAPPEEDLSLTGSPTAADAGGDSPSSTADDGDGTPVADGETVSPAEAAANARETALTLLMRAWSVRDRLEANAPRESLAEDRPLDRAPHLWREMQEELVAYEQAVQAGQGVDVATVGQVLQAALGKFWVAEGDGQVLTGDFERMQGKAPAGAAIQVSLDLKEVRSLALTQWIADQTGIAPPVDVAGLTKTLRGLVSTPAELPQWVADNWQAAFDQYYELRLVKRLAEQPNIESPLVQLALRARLAGEQVAASTPWAAGWLQDHVARGDRLRRAGERQLFDQIGSEWRQQAEEYFGEAIAQYLAAGEIAQRIHEARQLRNDLVLRAPYYVRLLAAAPSHADSGGADVNGLSAFLDDLITFSHELDSPSSAAIPKISELQQRLTHFQNRQESANEQMSRGRKLSGRDTLRVKALLDSPLPSSAERRSLLQTGGELVELARTLQLPRQFNITKNGVDLSSAWQRKLDRCRLEVQLAELATWHDDPTSTGNSLAELRQAYTDFEDLLDRPREELNDPTSRGEQDRWSSLRSFSGTLQEFYRRLPERVEAAQWTEGALDQTAAQRRVIRAQRALRLLDPRDAWQLRDARMDRLSADLNLHNMLLWQRRRCLLGQASAAEDEVNYLGSAAETYEAYAKRILRTTGGSSLQDGTEVLVPTTVSLVQRADQEIAIELMNRKAYPTDAWVILQYDPQVVRVDAPAGVYHEHQLKGQIETALYTVPAEAPLAIAAAEQDLALGPPLRPDLARLPASVSGLSAGAVEALKFQVTAISQAVESAPLIVKVISRQEVSTAAQAARSEATGRGGDPQSTTYVRRQIDLPMRVVEMRLAGPATTWTEAGNDLIFHPFPNRVTDFRFGVVNHGSDEKQVVLRFFDGPAGLDLANMTTDELQELSRELPALGEVTVSAPPDGKPHFVTAPEAAADAPAVAEKDEAAPPVPDTELAPPPGPRLRNDVLVQVRDSEDAAGEHTYFQRIRLVPQRPRRYVRPLVKYNSRLERIEVSVRPRLSSLLPQGPVRVECEIAEDEPSATRGKLRDDLMAPNYEANLFAYVPASPPQVVTLHLHVDGYPRAFTYKVPCGAHAVDLPEATKLTGVRILKTAFPGEYQPPAPATPVEIQIDAPVGSFAAGDDFGRVALDVNMDERLGPEKGSRFAPDRDTNVHLDSFSPDTGILSLDARIADFDVPLLTDRLQNVRVKVHGRVTAGDTSADAEPITLKIDGGAPRINYVEVSPLGGVVAQGTDLEVTIWAWDRMSGVKDVEVSLDTEGTGEFPAGGQPIKASRDLSDTRFDRLGNASGIEPHRWVAVLPTQDVLGPQTVLVRATDQVGNLSDVFQQRAFVLTVEQATAEILRQTKTVEGVASLREAPVGNTELVLFLLEPADDDAEAPTETEVASVQANELGSFQIPEVPPGEYRLKARGIIHNAPRFGYHDFTVDLAPGEFVRADIDLKFRRSADIP